MVEQYRSITRIERVKFSIWGRYYKNNLILPFLITPKQSFIEVFDTSGVILGNLTKNINFGGYEFESKVECNINDIRSSNFLKYIVDKGEKVKGMMKEFFKSNGGEVEASRLNWDDPITQEKFKERLKLLELKRKNLIEDIAEVSRERENLIIEQRNTEVGTQRRRNLKMEIEAKSEKIKSLKKIKNRNKLEIKSLKNILDTSEKDICIRNKQVMLSLLYLKQILMKNIPNDQKKMKNEFYVRETKFNNLSLADQYSLRKFKDFFLEKPDEFFNFVTQSEENVWSNINTCLPGATYIAVCNILKETGLINNTYYSIKDTMDSMHPVKTSVSSKTNLLKDGKDAIFQFKRREVVEEFKQKSREFNNKLENFAKVAIEGDEKEALMVREELKLVNLEIKDSLGTKESAELKKEKVIRKTRERVDFKGQNLEDNNLELRLKLKELKESIKNMSENEINDYFENKVNMSGRDKH